MTTKDRAEFESAMADQDACNNFERRDSGQYRFVITESAWQAWQKCAARSRSGAVPAGYALVPIEPTEEMMDASEAAAWATKDQLGRNADFDSYMHAFVSAQWRAALKAAPKPVETELEKAEAEVARAWDHFEAMCAAPVTAPAQAPVVTDDMVHRFLAWKLPETFSPDGGVRIDERWQKRFGWPPSGTNLLNKDEARAMLEHVLATSAVAVSAPSQAPAVRETFEAAVRGILASPNLSMYWQDGAQRYVDEHMNHLRALWDLLSAPADARDADLRDFIANRLTSAEIDCDDEDGDSYQVNFRLPDKHWSGFANAWVSSRKGFSDAIGLALEDRMGEEGETKPPADSAMGEEGGNDV